MKSYDDASSPNPKSNEQARLDRLQLIRRAAGELTAGPQPARLSAKPTSQPPLRRRWGLVPNLPLGTPDRHRALPGPMFMMLRR